MRKQNIFQGLKISLSKTDFDFIPNPKNYLKFGAGITHHTYSPGALSIFAQDGEDIGLDTLIGSQDETSLEYALYAENDMLLGPLKANIGIHFSAFDVNDKFYTSIQPRIGLNYLMPNDLALKVSFATMTQYINLLTSEALTLPTDLWVPSTEKIKPQQSWQAAGGIAKTLWDEYEFSVEGYYKKMKNVISFKEGASFLFGLEDDWQEKVTQGDGESYGAELFLQKKKGKTTGWVGYTLSWNYRQFDEINGGRKYAFRYDRRHDISVVLTHELTKKINLSAAWVYGTGNAVSLPVYSYEVYLPSTSNDYFNTYGVNTSDQKNAFRMTNYHRLDLSVEFIKKRRKWERAWVVSVYNAYNHNNPYFLYATSQFTPNGDKRVFKEVTLLPIIPSVSYRFKF